MQAFLKKYWGYLLMMIADVMLLLFLAWQGRYWYLQLVLALSILVYGARFYLKWKAD